MPNKKCKLFEAEKTLKQVAFIEFTAGRIDTVSEGYRKAGIAIYNECIASSLDRNTLVFPLIYCYRHAIELCLKELLQQCIILQITDFKISKKHKIIPLWEEYKKIMPYYHESEDMVKNVDKMLQEFNQIDMSSTTFRYPITRQERKEKHILPTIDIKNFNEKVNVIINFLEWQSYLIWEMIRCQN